MFKEFWKEKRVLITGHTGFKGSWLTLILSMMGAKVYGYSLKAAYSEGVYNTARISEIIDDYCLADIRNMVELSAFVKKVKPDFIFHMAAQPLVRASYASPAETFEINAMGTVNVLEAVRQIQHQVCIINITTDKCYQNNEWVWPYRENDRLGGRDPYSASKSCSELITAAYRESFYDQENKFVATARAGNVIGGGDWSADRLLPDIVRAYRESDVLKIRNPKATRPWQHVLEPLLGYILLAKQLQNNGKKYAQAWNFGPEHGDNKPVEWILEQISDRYQDFKWCTEEHQQVYESQSLFLDNSKAKAALNWIPKWNLSQSLHETMLWYEAQKSAEDIQVFSQNQIRKYLGALI